MNADKKEFTLDPRVATWKAQIESLETKKKGVEGLQWLEADKQADLKTKLKSAIAKAELILEFQEHTMDALKISDLQDSLETLAESIEKLSTKDSATHNQDKQKSTHKGILTKQAKLALLRKHAEKAGVASPLEIVATNRKERRAIERLEDVQGPLLVAGPRDGDSMVAKNLEGNVLKVAFIKKGGSIVAEVQI